MSFKFFVFGDSIYRPLKLRIQGLFNFMRLDMEIPVFKENDNYLIYFRP